MGNAPSTTAGGTEVGTSTASTTAGVTGTNTTSTTGASGTSGTSTTGATGTNTTSTTGATGTSGTSTATTTARAASAKGTINKEEPTQFLTSDLYGILMGVFASVLSIFVLFSTGSFLAVMVLWATMILILIVLVFYDIIDIDKLLMYQPPKKDEIVPEPSKPRLLGQTIGSEVFHINDQQFTYDEASAVCAAYDSELATLEQIMEAFAEGAEWCSYGWSAGGMALYPTQKDTWQRLQNEVDQGRRTRCGRPGVNGGYFDPSNKFGVNCFGFKPKGNFKPPAPVPGADTKKFNEMVKRFKNMMKAFTLDPYSRHEWSGYDSSPVKQAYDYSQKVVEGFMGRSSGYGLQFTQDLGALVREGMTNQNPYYEPIASASSQKFSAQGPYGLRGDVGPTGAAGPKGDAGAVGATGPAANVDPNSLSFNTLKIGNWDIKPQGDSLLFDDRTTTADDASMFKINRTSGSSLIASTSSSIGPTAAAPSSSATNAAAPSTTTPSTTTPSTTTPSTTTPSTTTPSTTTPSGPSASEIFTALSDINAARSRIITSLSFLNLFHDMAQNKATEAQAAATQTQNELYSGDFQGMNPGYFDSLINSAGANATDARGKANEIAAVLNPILTNYATLRTQDSSVNSGLQQLQSTLDDVMNKASAAEQAAASTVSSKARACDGTGYC